MTDLENWPRIIQLAWEYADETGQVHDTQKFLIKPDGWEIPSTATHGEKAKFWIENGFSTEQNEAEGMPMADVLDHFIDHLNVCDVIVAHNFNFDYPITGAEMIRYKKKPVSNPGRTKICTMQTTVGIVKAPFPNRGRFNSKQGYKWPTLDELFKHLFNKSFEGAHDAGNDVAACRLSFFELVKRGHLALPQIKKA